MSCFKCYEVTDDCRQGINPDGFSCFSTIDTNTDSVLVGSIIMYPLYQQLTATTDGHALAPVSVTFISQVQSKGAHPQKDAIILSVDPLQWTIANDQDDKSIILDPSGKNRVLLFAQTGRLFLKHRRKRNLYLTMPKGNNPVIQQLDHAQQMMLALRGAKVHPVMRPFAVPRLKKKLSQNQTQKQLTQKLTDMLPNEPARPAAQQ